MAKSYTDCVYVKRGRNGYGDTVWMVCTTYTDCVYMYMKGSCVGIDCTQCGGGGCVLDEKCKTVWIDGA